MACLCKMIRVSPHAHASSTQLTCHSPSSIPPDNSMYNWNILPFDVVNHDLSDLCFHSPIPQKEQISALESRLHASGQNDDDRRRGICCDGEPFPEHKGGRKHEGEVEELDEQLARCAEAEGGQHRTDRLFDLMLRGDGLSCLTASGASLLSNCFHDVELSGKVRKGITVLRNSLETSHETLGAKTSHVTLKSLVVQTRARLPRQPLASFTITAHSSGEDVLHHGRTSKFS